MAGQGFAADAFMSSFMRGFTAIEAMKERRALRAERADDRKYARTRDAVADQFRERQTVLAEKADVRAGNADTRAADEAARRAEEFEQGKKEWKTQEQIDAERKAAIERPGLETEGVRLRNEATRVQTTHARNAERRAQEDHTAEQRQRAALALYDWMESPQAQQFARPEFRRYAQDLDSFLKEGKPLSEGATAQSVVEGIVPFANELFGEEIGRVKGAKLDNGDTIENATISQVLLDEDGQHVLIGLNVTARPANGGDPYDYRAPLTTDRKQFAGDVDRIHRVSVYGHGGLRDIVRASALAARDFDQLEHGGGTPAEVRAAARRSYLEAGGDPVKLERGGARGGRQSAQIQFAQFVADNKFDGDVAKALDWIKRGNATQIASGIARTMFTAQEKDRRTRGTRTYEELYQDALRSIEGVQSETTAAPDATAGTGSATPAAEDAEADAYVEGQEYEDAQGNRAVYRNGNFEPIQ